MIRLASIAVCLLVLAGAAQAGVLNVDTAVDTKILPADPGWMEWVIPAGQTSATKSFGTIGATLATAGAAFDTQYQIGTTAPMAVVSDHAYAGGNYTLTLTGIPAGTSVDLTLYQAGPDPTFSFPYWSYARRTASINGGAAVDIPIYYTDSAGILQGSPFTANFVATGTDVITLVDPYGMGCALDGFSISGEGIPEPATMCLLLGGMGITALRRRHR